MIDLVGVGEVDEVAGGGEEGGVLGGGMEDVVVLAVDLVEGDGGGGDAWPGGGAEE